MVTAGELVVLSGSFTSRSMSVRRYHHLRGHASHERYIVSNVEGRELNLNKPIPRATGNRTRSRRMTGVHGTAALMFPPCDV